MTNKRVSRIIISGIMIAGLLGTALAQETIDVQSADIRIVYHNKLQTPSRITSADGNVLPMTYTARDASDPESVAMAFFKSYQMEYGLTSPEDELEVRSVQKDSGPYSKIGMTHVRLHQKYKGLPIFGAEAIVHMNKDMEVVSVSSKLIKTPDVSVNTKTTSNNLFDIATEAMPQNVVTARARGEEQQPGNDPDLGIFSFELLTSESRSPVLAYRVEALAYVTFLDAISNNILMQYDNVKKVRNRETYIFTDQTNPVITEDQYNGPTIIPIMGGLLVPTESCMQVDTEACYAHKYMADAYDYFLDVHGREINPDTYEGEFPNGGKLSSVVHHIGDNAFSDGRKMYFGESFASAQDVVGHEVAHLFIEELRRMFRDAGYGLHSPSVISESYSDVFAAMLDREDWFIGEDLPDDITSVCGALRSLSNPRECGSPDHLDMYIKDEALCPSYQCEHENNGILNKAAWLIAEGGEHNGVSVRGIGKNKLERIYYRTLTTRLDSTPDFADLRVETEASCNEMIGILYISADDCKQVRLAFIAVGITYANQHYAVTDYSPSIVFFKNKYFLAWVDPGRKELHISSSIDGMNWRGVVSTGETSRSAPTLLAVGEKLFVSWAGADKRLNIMQSLEGQFWTGKVTLDETSLVEPALAKFDNKLFISWRGTDNRLNIMSTSNEGRSWSGKVTLNEHSNYAPALVSDGDKIYIGWTGLNSSRLYLLSSLDGQSWDNRSKRMFNETSSAAPGLAYYNGGIHLAWTGTDTDHHVNIISSNDRVHWDGFHRSLLTHPSEVTSNKGPRLLARENSLHMTWNERGSPRHAKVMILHEK